MFHVEWTDDVQTIVIEARGATIGSAEQRNSDYTEGLELVLRRLGRAGFQLADAFVDSRDTQSLPRADQRLAVGADYPITIADAAELRRLMGAAQARVGREEGARGSGNRTKRIRLVVGDGGERMTDAALARRLAEGTGG